MGVLPKGSDFPKHDFQHVALPPNLAICDQGTKPSNCVGQSPQPLHLSATRTRARFDVDADGRFAVGERRGVLHVAVSWSPINGHARNPQGDGSKGFQ